MIVNLVINFNEYVSFLSFSFGDSMIYFGSTSLLLHSCRSKLTIEIVASIVETGIGEYACDIVTVKERCSCSGRSSGEYADRLICEGEIKTGWPKISKIDKVQMNESPTEAYVQRDHL